MFLPYVPMAHANQDKNPVTIYAIFHDEVSEEKRQASYQKNIRPFIEEFESFTGRKVSVVFDRNTLPYSNFDYKHDDLDTVMKRWERLATDYRAKRNAEGFPLGSLDRVLLITDGMINGSAAFIGTAGVAQQPGRFAIASLSFTQNIGHELGHTFDASHDEGEVLYNGWWCETFMFTPLPLRSSCLKFSEANKARINNYLNKYN